MRLALTGRWAERAFTLTEMMVTAAIATMVLAGVIMGHLVGIRMFQYTKTKLGGNDDARRAVNNLVGEIRTAKLIKVGDGDVNGFRQAPLGAPQQGNALQIYPTMDSNIFIRYFLGADDTLRRMPSDARDAPVLANFVTNRIIFTAETHNGLLLTNYQNNRVIGLNLQFYQIQYPIIRIGSNQLYDFYQIRTRVTRRVLE